jgi:hypothetical protein
MIEKDTNIIIKTAHQRELNKWLDYIGDEDVIDDTVRPLEQVDKGPTIEARSQRTYSVEDLFRAL